MVHAIAELLDLTQQLSQSARLRMIGLPEHVARLEQFVFKTKDRRRQPAMDGLVEFNNTLVDELNSTNASGRLYPRRPLAQRPGDHQRAKLV
ncbi:hypothetical protein [Sorangium sp. So ce861]|uniref:hypothetical protein n=1 Tax=Sorangium sp. So ce861 TaxID=3133323 RepID=UPI003F6344BC